MTDAQTATCRRAAAAALEQLCRIAFAELSETETGDVVALCAIDGPFRGWTAAEVLAWVDRQPPAFHRALTRALWRQPDLMVRVVKELRALATDGRMPAAVRRNATRTLLESGFDDESLRRE